MNFSENHVAKEIVDACYQAHVATGPGLLESVYEEILTYILVEEKHFSVQRQVPIRIEYQEVVMKKAFLADLIVENKVIVEIKSVEMLAPVHAKQLLTYLRLADLKLGLLVNFNVALIKDGIQRVVNNL